MDTSTRANGKIVSSMETEFTGNWIGANVVAIGTQASASFGTVKNRTKVFLIRYPSLRNNKGVKMGLSSWAWSH